MEVSMLHVGAIDLQQASSAQSHLARRLEPLGREEKTEVALKDVVWNQLPLPCKTGSNAVSESVFQDKAKQQLAYIKP